MTSPFESCRPRYCVPSEERATSKLSVMTRLQQVSSNAEEVLDQFMNGQEPLQQCRLDATLGHTGLPSNTWGLLHDAPLVYCVSHSLNLTVPCRTLIEVESEASKDIKEAQAYLVQNVLPATPQ